MLITKSGGEPFITEASESGPANHPFTLLRKVFSEAEISGALALDRVVIGLGPGSYTGIRSALAIAQGFELSGAKADFLGLSSSKVLASQAAHAGISGHIHTVIDAQRGEAYVEGFHITGGVASGTQPLRLVSVAELTALTIAGALMVGPDAARWFPQGLELRPSAAALAKLALLLPAPLPSPSSASLLEPIYLRVPQFVKAPKPRVISEA